MDIIHARCAMHKQTVVGVCVGRQSTARHEVRTFATTAAGLRALQGWPVAAGCTHAVLESTCVLEAGGTGSRTA